MTKNTKYSNYSDVANSEASKLNVAQLPSSEKELGSFPARLQQVIGDRSVRSFASDCGMSDTVVRQYLSGKSEPTRPAIIAIARISGCSIDWLMTGAGDMRRGAGDRAAEPGTVQHILDAEHKAEINQSIKRFGCYPLDQALLKRSLEGAYEWVKTEGLESDPETIFKIMMYRYNLVATIKFGAMDKEREG